MCTKTDNFRYDSPAPPPPPKLIVSKSVIGAPDKPESDFEFRVNGGPPTAFAAAGENELTLAPGIYNVVEVPEAGFTTTFDNCSNVVLDVPQQVVPVCTITNTALPAQPLMLIVRKVVVGSAKPVGQFSFTVNGQTTPFEPDGQNEVTLPAGTYTVTEPPVEGFETTRAGCDDIVIAAPQSAPPICTITNTAEQPPPIPIAPVGVSVKCVDNLSDGSFTVTFGYHSENLVDVVIPVGELNQVTPEDPEDGVYRGQPATFEPGTVVSAFTVAGGSGQTVTWRVTSPPQAPGSPPFVSSASGSATFETKCTEPPDPPPATVEVVVTCVENRGETYSATFGYRNPTAAPVHLPVDPQQNGFSPGAVYRGQPETFVPGEVVEAVRVGDIANSVDLTWRVDTGNGEPSTAIATDAFATKCSVEPPPEPGPPDTGPPDGGLPDPGPPDPEQEPIGIFIDCVTDRGPTYDAVFGYQNDNEDTVVIPIGSDNRFVPGENRGQTTVFLPGNHSNAFVVEGIPSRLLLSWAVTHAGATRVATPFSGMPQCGDRPPPLVPVGIFACITDRGGTFDAVFGYENDNTVDVTLPVGLRNFFTPQPANRGQPTVFHPGRHDNAFTVRGIRGDQVLAWTLAFEGVRTVVVTAAYPIECARPETLPVDVFPLCVSRRGDTYTAAFGYVNSNRRDVVVPVGVSNFVSPRPISRGQPSVLRPGVAWHAFSVRGIPVGQPVTWTVRSPGAVARATLTAGFERDCVFTPVLPEAQLEIDKSVEPDTAFVGDRLRFEIVVRNEGTTTAQSVAVNDVRLDDGIVLLSATTSQGRCRVLGGGSRVQCLLDALDPGATATIRIVGRAQAAGRSRNRATVSSLPKDFGIDNVDQVTMVLAAVRGPTRPPFTG